MKHSLKRISFSMAVLFTVASGSAQAQPDAIPKIALETKPVQVCADKEFELIWRVSADNAKILKVFADIADTSGPEYTWRHDGTGAFEATVKHTEVTAGMKEYELWTKISNDKESRFAGESFKINVAGKDGDQDLKTFLSWMRDVGYSDDTIKVYAHDGSNPVVREQWNKYFTMRKEGSTYRELQTMPIVFIDILATEENAVNETLAGQTDKLKDYMTRIYGKPFEIEYLEERVSYETNFGKPTLQKNAGGKKWLKFNPAEFNKFARETAKRITGERELPNNAVMIHWAAKKWKYEGDTLKVEDHTGSSPALSGMGFDGFGLATYAHEWGHGLGLGHMFVVGPGSYASRTWGLDCIMNHTYVPYSNPKAGRFLSPLPRYALEPKDGYIDQKGFAAAYSEAMAGTEHLKRRLSEVGSAVTAVSTMTWSTPWTSSSEDSVICQGLQNRNFEIKKLELKPGIEPGEYSLVFDRSRMSGPQRTLLLTQDGQTVASAQVAWMTRVSYENHYEISFEKYLSLSIGRSNKRGGSTLAGLGKLLNGKTLIVPVKRVK